MKNTWITKGKLSAIIATSIPVTIILLIMFYITANEALVSLSDYCSKTGTIKKVEIIEEREANSNSEKSMYLYLFEFKDKFYVPNSSDFYSQKNSCLSSKQKITFFYEANSYRSVRHIECNGEIIYDIDDYKKRHLWGSIQTFFLFLVSLSLSVWAIRESRRI